MIPVAGDFVVSVSLEDRKIIVRDVPGLLDEPSCIGIRMRIDVVTIFPDLIRAVLGFSIVKRAQEAGVVEVHVHDLRDWAPGVHRSTDDTPYGGGAGMVMRPGPLFDAVESLPRAPGNAGRADDAAGEDVHAG